MSPLYTSSPSVRPAQAPRPAQVLAALQVIHDCVQRQKPVDQLLEACFKANRAMGRQDRAAVSAVVYGVLRACISLQAQAGDNPAQWLSQWLTARGFALPRELPPPLPAWDADDLLAHQLPTPWWAALCQTLPAADALHAAMALQHPAPPCLRVNRLRHTPREAVMAQLAAEGIVATPTTMSADGLLLSKRLPRLHPLERDGVVAWQDEGSQLIAQALAAQPGEQVLDYCAGAGGKALALASAMMNTGTVWAHDIDPTRLARLPARALAAGADCIRLLPPDSPNLGALRCDAVLVDAPCTGSGTLRRAPDLRLRPQDPAALATLQSQVLAQAAHFVKPGGRLLYATCSLFAIENEAVVDQFLQSHPHFAPAPTPNSPGPWQDDGRMRLWPHQHGCDGFFMALLQRVG